MKEITEEQPYASASELSGNGGAARPQGPGWMMWLIASTHSVIMT